MSVNARSHSVRHAPNCHGSGLAKRTPHHHADGVTLYTGDAAEVLAELPDRSVHSIVTSPPYYGLRDYGTGRWLGGDPHCRHSTGRGCNVAQTKNPNASYPASTAHRGGHPRRCSNCGATREDQQVGLEASPGEYIDRIRGVFAQLHRVLVDTGTAWLNLGDCYSSEPPGRARDLMHQPATCHGEAGRHLLEPVQSTTRSRSGGISRKNLMGMPWHVAFALQRDGWILRNAIVWHKPNAMPESVKDRLSNRYEMLFFLVKQQRYHFDLDPLRIPLSRPEALDEGIVIGGANKGRNAGVGATARRRGGTMYGKYTATTPFTGAPPGEAMRPTGMRHSTGHPNGKNPGDVWSIGTRPLREAHFAAYPIDIPLRCIAAGCPEGGLVLDPFSGAATTGMAARQLGRSYIGIDLNPEFHDIGKRRLARFPSQWGRAA